MHAHVKYIFEMTKLLFFPLLPIVGIPFLNGWVDIDVYNKNSHKYSLQENCIYETKKKKTSQFCKKFVSNLAKIGIFSSLKWVSLIGWDKKNIRFKFEIERFLIF